MKALALFFAVIFGLSVAHAQTLRKDGDRYELTFTSAEASEAHKSANVFTKAVGDILKSAYPSKVLDPAVSLTVFTKNSTTVFRFVWSCRIVKTNPNDADYYFDRRGTLLSAGTLAHAKHNVEAEIAASGKVASMRKEFRNTKIPKSFIRDSSSGSHSEGYWYVKEFFMVAPK